RQSASPGSWRTAGGPTPRCAGATGRSSPPTGAISSSSETSKAAAGMPSADLAPRAVHRVRAPERDPLAVVPHAELLQHPQGGRVGGLGERHDLGDLQL